VRVKALWCRSQRFSMLELLTVKTILWARCVCACFSVEEDCKEERNHGNCGLQFCFLRLLIDHMLLHYENRNAMKQELSSAALAEVEANSERCKAAAMAGGHTVVVLTRDADHYNQNTVWAQLEVLVAFIQLHLTPPCLSLPSRRHNYFCFSNEGIDRVRDAERCARHRGGA
jgi:hypothetical protein